MEHCTRKSFSNFEEAANYCLSLGDGWNRPLTRQIEIELKKEASERAPEINEALEALSDYGGFGTFPMTMVADAQLQYKKVIRREDPFGWVQFGGTDLSEYDRYLCVRPVVLRPIGKNKKSYGHFWCTEGEREWRILLIDS